MAEHNLPQFFIDPKSPKNDILKLLKIIKPQWTESDIEIKSMTGRYTCSLYRVYSKTNQIDAVVIRMLNIFVGYDVPGMDREIERKIIQLAAKEGIFPRVHAIFENGYCYKYVEGKPMFDTTQTFGLKSEYNYEKLPLRLMALKLAKLQCLKCDSEDFTKTNFFANILDVLDNFYPSSNPFLTDKNILRKEFVELMELSKNFNFNLVLSHGDLHPGNIVWNEETNEITIMDWELIHVGLQPYDVAYLLFELTDPVCLKVSGTPSIAENIAENLKKKFLGFYFEEYSRLSNFELTEAYVVEFERQVKFCYLITCLVMSAYMGPLANESSKCPDWKNICTFGIKIFKRYCEIKDDILIDLNLKNFPTKMAEVDLPDFSIDLKSPQNDILKLMKIIKPQWNVSDIEMKLMTGGYQCIMYRVYPKTDPKDGVAVRVNNIFANYDVPGMDKGFERKTVQIASKQGIFPKVYAMYKNGYCYQYIEGKAIFDTTQSDGMKMEYNYEKLPLKLMASKLVEIQSLKIENEDFSTTNFFTKLLELLDTLYPPSHPYLVDRNTLRKEFVELMELSKNFKFNLVLSHGDLHPGNMIWNEDKNEVMIMDWELMHIGLQPYDVAYLLLSMTDPEFLATSGLPSLEEKDADALKKMFTGFYLEAYSKSHNIELTKDFVTEFERQVKFCYLISCLVMSSYMGPLANESSKCADWENICTFGLRVYKQYCSMKDGILAELNFKK